jgi:hypothetical protein
MLYVTARTGQNAVLALQRVTVSRALVGLGGRVLRGQPCLGLRKIPPVS